MGSHQLLTTLYTNAAVIALQHILPAVLPIRMAWEFVKMMKSDNKSRY
jgi:hypothetical protein